MPRRPSGARAPSPAVGRAAAALRSRRTCGSSPARAPRSPSAGGRRSYCASSVSAAAAAARQQEFRSEQADARRARVPAPWRRRPGSRCSLRAGSRRRPRSRRQALGNGSSVASYASRRAAARVTCARVSASGWTKTSPVSAVHRHQGAGRDQRAGVAQPGHGRHVDGTRQDGGVIRPAARVRDERGQPLPVELGDHRRRDLVRDQDQRAPIPLNRSAGSSAARRFMHSRPTTSATSPLRSRR